MYYTTLDDGNKIYITDPDNRGREYGKFYAYKYSSGWNLSVMYRFNLNQETNQINSNIFICIYRTDDHLVHHIKEVIEAPTSDLNEARKLYEFMEMI